MSTFAVAAVLIAITAAPISATVTGTTRRSMPTPRPTRARPAIAAPANVPPPAFVKADTTHAVNNGTFDLGTVALTATAGSPATRWRLDGGGRQHAVGRTRPVPLAIVLLGHSRGAALAAILGRRTGAPRLSRPVSGLVQLAPSVGSVDPTLLADLPAAVVIGTCDGDTGVDGGRFVAPSLDRARRTTPVGLVMIDHATHDATNDRLALEAPPPGRPGCGATQWLEPVAQRQLLMALVPEVARATLGATSSGASATIFDRLRADDQVQPGVRIVHVDPTTVRTSLLPKLGQLVPTAGFTSGLELT